MCRNQTIEECLLGRVNLLDECELFTGPLDKDGYAKLHGQNVHRERWIAAHGPIPKGLELDHTCGKRHCVRLSHLELVTHAENIRRAYEKNPEKFGPVALKGNRSVCLRDHLMDAANTKVNKKTGQRACRTCIRARGKKVLQPQ